MKKYEIKVTSEHKNERLDVFLCETLENISRSQVKNLFKNNLILLNGKLPQKAGILLKETDILEVNTLDKKPLNAVAEPLPLNIIYEDEYLAVINKPQGMVVHPAVGHHSGTLVNALLYHFKSLSTNSESIRPGIVHRLDKDTSGLLVIAKNNIVHESLSKQIKEKSAKRIYRAIVSGILKEETGTINKNLERSKLNRKKIAVTQDNKGRTAITHYKVLEYLKGFTYVEFVLETGRTHQIRVHSNYIGHPVLGDKEYGYNYKNLKLKGQLLHAYKLSFIHPITKESLTFTSELPDYFVKILNKLKN